MIGYAWGMVKSLALFIYLLCLCAVGSSQKVGDRVQAWVSGSAYPGKIVGVGSGSMVGYFLVRFDSGTQQYVKASNIKVSSGAAVATASAPRSGRYVILSYGNPSNPIRIGYVNLTGSSYQYETMAHRPIGSG